MPPAFPKLSEAHAAIEKMIATPSLIQDGNDGNLLHSMEKKVKIRYFVLTLHQSGFRRSLATNRPLLGKRWCLHKSIQVLCISLKQMLGCLKMRNTSNSIPVSFMPLLGIYCSHFVGGCWVSMGIPNFQLQSAPASEVWFAQSPRHWVGPQTPVHP